MAAAIEVELKLAADDERPLRALAAAASLGAWPLGPPHPVEELDRYLDTADARLATARWACRLRTRDGVTRLSLKGPALHAPSEAAHRRPEVEGPATDDLNAARWPASAARERLLEMSGDQPLREWLTLRQRRVERTVGVPSFGLLSLDEVTVWQHGTQRGAFAVVELELAGGDDRLLPALLDALRSVPGLAPEPRSKLERALELLPAGQ